MRALLGLLLALAALPATSQEPPEVSVAFAPGSVTVGDRVETTLTLALDPAELAGEPRFPVWQTTWGEAEVLDTGEPRKIEANGKVIWQQTLVLTAFRPGAIDLPQVEVAVPLPDRTVQARTPAGLSLQVASVLPTGEEPPEPRPPAPLRQLPLGAPFWWTLAALSLTLLALAAALWRRHRAEESAEGTRPALPPFDDLMGELDRLAAEPSALRLHTRLSLALRSYLGRSLSFPAAESTTSEIHRSLVARRVPGSVVRPLVEILRDCDLVKFARQDVGEERTRERVAAARRAAREMETWMRPVEPADLPAGPRLEKAG